VKPAEVAKLLAKCAAYDQRTVGEADVLAWHEILARVDLADAFEAVRRHYAESRERVMPADILRLSRQIREERNRATAEPLALPSRFEVDEIRDQRLKAGLALVRSVLPQPEPGSPDDIHGKALARAKAERGNRPNPATERRRDRARKLPDLAKVTAGPWWALPHKREEHALAVLGEAGRLRTCNCSMCQREES